MIAFNPALGSALALASVKPDPACPGAVFHHPDAKRASMSVSSNLSSDENKQPRQRSLARRTNGVVTDLLVAFFLGAHGLLGSASAIVALDSSLSWIAWIGTAAIAVHVCLNVRVTIEKLSDPEKPPSAHKKMKIAFRWATGVVLAVAIGLLIILVRTHGACAAWATPPAVAATVVLIAALSAHVFLCLKSLIRDLGGSKELKDKVTPLVRAVLCAFACLLCAMVVAGYLR